jgi:hypothetical protein
MNNYCVAIRKIEDKFEGLEFHHVERDHDMVIDALSMLGSSQVQALPDVFVQEIEQPDITSGPREECKAIEQVAPLVEQYLDDLRSLIINYIRNEEEPDEKTTAESIMRQTAHYTVIGDALYRRGTTDVFMKCIDTSVGKHLLEEIHARHCRVHVVESKIGLHLFLYEFWWLNCPTQINWTN